MNKSLLEPKLSYLSSEFESYFSRECRGSYPVIQAFRVSVALFCSFTGEKRTVTHAYVMLHEITSIRRNHISPSSDEFQTNEGSDVYKTDPLIACERGKSLKDIP